MTTASNTWIFLVRQWLVVLPGVMVFLGGFIVALVYWKHCPRAALLTVLAVPLVVLPALVQPPASTYLTELRGSHSWTYAQYEQRSMYLALGFNVVRSMGYILLLAAIFTGRRPTGPIYPPLPTDRRIL